MSALLPQNSSELERAVEFLALARIGDLAVPLRSLWSAQDCPEGLLPWLAWALSIDNWDPAWPLHIRRARVAAAIAIQRRKGTRRSVSDVVTSFGGNVEIREWFEQDPPGDPHTFTLSVALGGQGADPPSASFIDAVVHEVTRTKPARSHFTFSTAGDARGGIGLLGAARALVSARISLASPPAPA